MEWKKSPSFKIEHTIEKKIESSISVEKLKDSQYKFSLLNANQSAVDKFQKDKEIVKEFLAEYKRNLSLFSN